MKYILLSPGKLKVTLTPGDLAELSITDQEPISQAAKQALQRILEKGKEETGFNPGRSRLYIELYPCDDGGMAVYFTCLTPGGAPRLAGGGGKTPVPVVFAFDDADTLTEGCTKAFHHYSHRIYKSSLYKLGNSYRLTVYPLDYADRLSVLFLSEYGHLKGEGEVLAAFVEEHGKQLIADNALDVLANYFSGG